MPNWIPQADADFDGFINNFADRIVAAPTDYGLVVGDGTAIDAARDAWVTAYGKVLNPTTDTPTNRAMKRATRASSAETMRVMAGIVRANPAVTNENKLELGIVIRDPTPTPIPAPTAVPTVTLIKGGSGTHRIRIRDTDTPTTNAKPANVKSCELRYGVSTVALADPADADRVELRTVANNQVEFDPEDDKKKVTYFARWVSARGLTGPWSTPLTVTVMF